MNGGRRRKAVGAARAFPEITSTDAFDCYINYFLRTRCPDAIVSKGEHGGGAGGAALPWSSNLGGSPLETEDPLPSPMGQVDPPSKNGVFLSLRDQSLSLVLYSLKKAVFQAVCRKKISACAELFFLQVYFEHSVNLKQGAMWHRLWQVSI